MIPNTTGETISQSSSLGLKKPERKTTMSKIYELATAIWNSPFSAISRSIEKAESLTDWIGGSVSLEDVLRILRGEFSTGEALVDAACAAILIANGIVVDVYADYFTDSYDIRLTDTRGDVLAAMEALSKQDVRLPVRFRLAGSGESEKTYKVFLDSSDIAKGRFIYAPAWVTEMSGEELFQVLFA